MNYKEIVEHGDTYFLPNLSVDVVIVGYENHTLKCLLLKIGDKWLLPGGHVKRDESVQEAVNGILKSRAGLENNYLKFLAVFGDKNRVFKKVVEEFFSDLELNGRQDSWLNDRFVSLAYYTLVDIEKTNPTVSAVDEAFGWFDFEDLPKMWMDHEEIALTARRQLVIDVKHEYLAYNLLPEKFTMPELHELHQTILGENIDRSRFQKKMLATGLFIRLPRLQKNAPGRNPYLYRLK